MFKVMNIDPVTVWAGQVGGPFLGETSTMASKVRISCPFMPRYSASLLVCFCALSVVPAGAQTDRVSRLIVQMKGKDFAKQKEAVQALIKIGAPAVEPLIAALTDSRDYVRENAMDALAGIKDPRAIEPLIALFPVSGNVQSEVRGTLTKFGAPTREPLIAAMKSSDARIRDGAADTLGSLADPRSIDALADALMDPDVFVSQDAARALAEIKDPRVVEPALAFLMNTNDLRYYNTRELVVEMLIRLNDPRAVGTLQKTGHISSAVYELIETSEPGSEDALIAALNEFGTVEIARDFLNCGNSKLEEAARAWVAEHGYKVTRGIGRDDYPHWNTK
ncbi:MAG: HEAT repeat domain-containing protein [Terriglobia bacterium]